ncbi:MAG: hypothetical protein HC905_14250 [Bacteroidales bacterium]|nr:hypothetical protein [Bacteroidales bacterium]
MMKKTVKIFLLAVLTFYVTNSAIAQQHKSSLLQFDKQIDNLLSQMTLEEKVNMLHGKHMFVSSGVERLGIADMIYADGPFGIRGRDAARQLDAIEA